MKQCRLIKTSKNSVDARVCTGGSTEFHLVAGVGFEPTTFGL